MKSQRKIKVIAHVVVSLKKLCLGDNNFKKASKDCWLGSLHYFLMTVGIKGLLAVLPYDPVDMCRHFHDSWANKILDLERNYKYVYFGRTEMQK